jgi:hypothetical protein
MPMRTTTPSAAFHRQHCTTSRLVAVVEAVPTVSAYALTHVRCSDSNGVCMHLRCSMPLCQMRAIRIQHEPTALLIAVVDTLPAVMTRLPNVWFSDACSVRWRHKMLMRATTPSAVFHRCHCTTFRFVAVVEAVPTVSAYAFTHVRCSESDTICMRLRLSMQLHTIEFVSLHHIPAPLLIATSTHFQM